MKLILAASVVVSFGILLYSRTPVSPQSIHEPRPPGMKGPRLIEIGTIGTLRIGAPVYFRTNVTACGVIRGHEASHSFGDGSAAPAVLIEWKDGKRAWIKRQVMQHALVPDEESTGLR